MAIMGRAVWAFGLAILMVCASQVANAITCGDGITNLLPCLTYLRGGEEKPSAPCCMGVQKLNKMASSTEDRRTLCDCFKKAGPSFGVKPERAKELPQSCGVSLPFPVDPNVDCSKIPFPQVVGLH